MPSVLEFIQALVGGKSAQPAQPAFTPAPPLTSYPSHDDAAYAKQYGFGYGSGNEAALNNEAANVFGMNHVSVPSKGKATSEWLPVSSYTIKEERTNPDSGFVKNVDLTKPENAGARDKIADTYMRAALTANRIPIAALGFDPKRMANDVVTRSNLNGLYQRSTDGIYVGNYPDPATSGILPEQRIQSTPVHEAIHRGLKILSDTPEGKALYSKLPGDEEYLVRWLMQSQAGNPEENTGVGKREGNAIYGTGKYEDLVKQINELAQKQIAARKPRGPI